MFQPKCEVYSVKLQDHVEFNTFFSNESLGFVFRVEHKGPKLNTFHSLNLFVER